MKVSLIGIAGISLGMAILLIGTGMFIDAVFHSKEKYNAITETRNVSNFNKIDVKGLGDVEIKYGDKESVVVSASEQDLKDISTTVKDGVLIIDTEKDNKIIFMDFKFDREIKFVVTVKDLNSVDMEGMGNLKAEKLTGDDFKISADGLGNVNINTFEATDLEIDKQGSGNIFIDDLKSDKVKISCDGLGNLDIKDIQASNLEIQKDGSGNIDMTGNVEFVRFEMNGLGNFTGKDLIANEAEIRHSGSGNIDIAVKKELDVKHEGMGNIRYWGNPTVKSDIDGAGNFKSMGEIK